MLLLIAFLPLLCPAQPVFNKPDNQENSAITTILAYSEQMPIPPCDLQKFFAKNLHYPADALKQQVEGRVYIEFFVTETGYLDSIRLKKGLLPSMNEEALKLVNTLPQPWQPGKNLQNQPTKFWYVVPVIFRLE